MDIKTQYSNRYGNITQRSLYLNKRLFSTYFRIVERIAQKGLSGVNIDLGCGDRGFSKVCDEHGIVSYPYDYPEYDLENHPLAHEDECIDFVTMNAVLEHVLKPDHIMGEIKRVLKPGGFLFVRTPNWKMDFKNFFNDATHVKPYAPQTLKSVFLLAGFDAIFIEPGLVRKSWFWWRLPDSIKWHTAAMLRGGTKSIIGIAQKGMKTD